MTPEERVAFIRTRLEAALSPHSVVIKDDSARHAGHTGHGGGGHYQVTIVAEAFAGKSRIERHRLVYDAVGETMGNEIHALSIKAYTPQEYPES
ncbi:BolA family protein [Nitrosococcus wardiae]|uniref:BolA family transcriptional regulator n=1 Tax=Nitrosococcus wardiae TaxID=1814290 RepID=A0A4P7BX72_9GAMM|nr:BolA family protein [Nitrosococcus wardiae]QBQ54591.1 BolA family transcriptional regulator [Nitrosococcus wardiae]